jgi:hypothetical protein
MPRLTIAVLCLLGAACGGEITTGAAGDSGEEEEAALTASPSLVGKRVRVTASALNLRTGPSTSYRVITSMPNGTELTVAAVSGGWLKTTYAGSTGWCSATYVELVGGSTPPPPPPPSSEIDEIMQRARSGVGFSYHWGGGCWQPGSSAKGACYGSCPNCSHSGQWGADCSGYVAKVWQVPKDSALTTCAHPYSTYNFTNESTHWRTVSRSSARMADALTYNSGGAGHIMLFESGDAWGWAKAYEAKGCSTGIVYNTRMVGSAYKAIRRNGL